MILKKKKTAYQIALLQTVASRLKGLDKELFAGGEPCVANRLGALLTELQANLDNSESSNGR